MPICATPLRGHSGLAIGGSRVIGTVMRMTTCTMTATLIREHGGPNRLLVETVERPRPRAGEVVVRVAACALNHLDIFVRRGMPGASVTLPHTTGGDIAGWIEALGPGVDGHSVGDSVLVDPAIPTG